MLDINSATICIQTWSLPLKNLLFIVLEHLSEQQIKSLIKELRSESKHEEADVLAEYYAKTYSDKIPALLRPRFA